jgi:hypothetical protein
MSVQELSSGQKNLFKKIYEPENFERRLIGWLENVKYFSDLYSTRKKNLFRFFIIIKILRHFLFRVPRPVRSMFWNVLKASWKINPRLISRSMSVLVQYWHYYDFGHKDPEQKPGFGKEKTSN